MSGCNAICSIAPAAKRALLPLRFRGSKKIEALTAQGLTQGMIITAVPFFLLAVFLIVDPGYVMPLFTTTLGLIALIVMLALQGIGGFLMLKIVKINV